MIKTARITLLGVGVAVAATISLGLPAVAAASPPPAYTCNGGTVPGGTYRTLTIEGMCTLDGGPVTVGSNLTVNVDAALLAAFSGSDLTVGGDLVVRYRGILLLGCEPDIFPCFNEPTEGAQPNWSTNDHILGNLIGQQPLMMVVHNNTIDGSISHAAGGGGPRCDRFPLGHDGPPAYSTYEDNHIGGSATVVGLRTCWFGFIRNTVGRSAILRDNHLGDRDGNEYVSNVIALDLRCRDNKPQAQIGDSGGSPNTVGRTASGECRSLV